MAQCLKDLSEQRSFIAIGDGISLLHPVWQKALGTHTDSVGDDRSQQLLGVGLLTDQIRRLPCLAEHLKEHLRRLLQQLDPVTEIGGMALDLAADLQPIAQKHRP